MKCRDLAVLALLGLSVTARAALGDAVERIADDRQRLNAVQRAAAGPLAQPVHTLQWSDGSAVRQYAGSDGIVFAVAWSTRTKPRLDVLLGAQYAAYRRAVARSTARPAHHGVWQDGDLVVESTVNGHAFVGRAYLKSRWSAARNPDAIR